MSDGMDIEDRLETVSRSRERHSKGKAYDELMNLPSAAELELAERDGYTRSKESISRAVASIPYRNTSERFYIKNRTFENQYADIYFKRLKAIKPHALKAAHSANPKKDIPVLEKLLDIKDGIHCIIVGTLFKNMPAVPRVLDEFNSKQKKAVSDVFMSANDTLILEDETGRTTLVGDILKEKINHLVTGIVLAVKGTSLRGGEFQVEEFYFPGLPAQVSPPREPASKNRYIALISGTRVGDVNQNPLALELFLEYVSGHSGTSLEREEVSSSIVRVVFAGNSLCPPEDTPDGHLLTIQKALNSKQQRNLVAPLRELDSIMSQLATSIPVDVMAGPNDPANYTLPQQPLNKCLFPLSYNFASFTSVPNPYEFELDGRLIFGSSGQTLDNMERYMIVEDKLSLLESTLNWRHSAPLTPDQLGCYPFHDTDPFVIEKCPHIYFVGNQKQFQTKMVTGPSGQHVRLVLLPSFAETGTVVLVNLETLAAHPICFNASL